MISSSSTSSSAASASTLDDHDDPNLLPPSRGLAIEAHEQLLEATTNFWERAWLRRSITKLAKP